MSAITNLWRQMVQRRLWPVAILLIAGLAAVPMLLAQEPEPTASAPAPAPAAAADDGGLSTEPIVAAAVSSGNPEKHKVVGRAKNPFGLPKQARDASAAAPNSKGSVVSHTGTSDDDAPSSGTGSDAPSTGGGTPTAPGAPATPVEPQPQPKVYAPQELTVRFGGDDRKRQSLERLEALPSEAEPVLIYMGLVKNGKYAEFMVGDGVVPVGDGDCRPSPEECETVRLRAGETEFFDIKDATGNVTDQFQLDLIKIHNAGGASASASKRKAKANVKAAVRMLQGDAGLRATAGQSVARLP
jgi:hypothetical protein